MKYVSYKKLQQLIKAMLKGKKNIAQYLFFAALAFAFVFGIVFIYTSQLEIAPTNAVLQKVNAANHVDAKDLEKKVLPPDGITLPVRWGNLGLKMIKEGVIDPQKFADIYKDRGGIDPYAKELLFNANNGFLKITPDNAGIILNLLWALGLGNRNDILDKGPMRDEHNGGAGNFASTGGWTLARGEAMDHFSHHSFIQLTNAQQLLVEDVSKHIYRPCCGNSTYFPDCNHGMAMLGLLELMASQGIGEKEMYKAALQVNAYWFPDTYLTIATYLAQKGIKWEEVDPKTPLGEEFSSASGYRNVKETVTPTERKNQGGSCGV